MRKGDQIGIKIFSLVHSERGRDQACSDHTPGWKHQNVQSSKVRGELGVSKKLRMQTGDAASKIGVEVCEELAGSEDIGGEAVRTTQFRSKVGDGRIESRVRRLVARSADLADDVANTARTRHAGGTMLEEVLMLGNEEKITTGAGNRHAETNKDGAILFLEAKRGLIDSRD